MRLKGNGAELAFLHLENQSGVSNVMPLRDMGYLYSGYQNQLCCLKEENRKEGAHYAVKEIGDNQKLCPVISLVLYYGTEEWTGPTHLKDMLDIPEEKSEFWEALVEDHKIRLVDLGRQSDEEVSRYRSDLWYIVKCLKCGKDKEKYKEFLAEQIICEQKEEGGDCTMYSFLDYFEEVGLEKGRKEGLEKGLEEGLEKGLERGIERGQEQLYYKMFSKERTPEDISEFTGESVEYLYDLKEKYLATVREESRYGSGKEKGALPENE